MLEGKDEENNYRNKPNRMSESVIMVILIPFHSEGFRYFKYSYLEYVCEHLFHLFQFYNFHSI